MKNLIGIRALTNISVESLKQDFLFFDKLYIIGLKEWFYETLVEFPYRKVRTFNDMMIFDMLYTFRYISNKTGLHPSDAARDKELEYLINNDKIVLNRPTIYDIDEKDIQKCINLSNKINEKGLSYINLILNNNNIKNKKSSDNFDIDIKDFGHMMATRQEPLFMNLDNKIFNLAIDSTIKEQAIWYNHHLKYKSIPIIDNYYSNEFSDSKRYEVLKIVLNHFPLPTKDCNWEDIFNFKNDDESYLYFLKLKNFINDISNSNLSIKEIDEKIEFLLLNYRLALKKHKLKVKEIKKEKFVIKTIGLIENLLKGNLSELFKWHFQLKKEEIALHELELKEEGSELAYIEKVNIHFKS
ncbi:MAG: hypothetical protein RO257_18430 [Candidatus Kapabacteria bacterium]|nr:hypothetical protein [Candidatus Kapabacteria bacterium]MDT3741470.1 hypothetical protein [Candidatus Kapabacteria bacterium]